MHNTEKKGKAKPQRQKTATLPSDIPHYLKECQLPAELEGMMPELFETLSNMAYKGKQPCVVQLLIDQWICGQPFDPDNAHDVRIYSHMRRLADWLQELRDKKLVSKLPILPKKYVLLPSAEELVANS